MAHASDLSPDELKKANIKRIWTVAGILAAVTTLEFIIAFTVPAGFLRTSIFVIMTIFKAFYIVADFMHLRHEVKALIWSIMLPTVFVAWFILAMLMEGNWILIQGWVLGE